MIGFDQLADYPNLKKEIESEEVRYENIGRSWLFRNIYCLRIGEGARKVLFVGNHHATDYNCGHFLLRWAQEMNKALLQGTQYLNYNMKTLCEKNSIYVIPMPNPDGVDLVLHGITDNNPFKERIKRVDPEFNFSDWKSNIRAIDLNRNYNAGWIEGKMQERKRKLFAPSKSGYGGEYPESELETASVSYFIRKLCPDIVYSVGMGNRRISYGFNGKHNDAAYKTALVIAKYSGFNAHTSKQGDEDASFGSLKDWVSDAFSVPSFELFLAAQSKIPTEMEKEYIEARDIFTVACVL